MTDDARLSLDVTLELGGPTVHGTLDDGVGPVLEFTGWLELMSAFDTVTARTSYPRATGPGPQDCS